MDYRGLGRVNVARGAGSAKWIHCGIIIRPYLDQHRPNYNYYTRLQLLADDANSYYEWIFCQLVITDNCPLGEGLLVVETPITSRGQQL